MPAAIRPISSKTSNARRTTPRQRRQQHMLDVSVRTSQASQQRKQWFLGFSAKVLLAACLGVALYFGVKKGVAWLVLKNPDTTLRC